MKNDFKLVGFTITKICGKMIDEAVKLLTKFFGEYHVRNQVHE